MARHINSITPDVVDIIAQWCRNGMTRADVAQALGIHASTLSSWGKKLPSLKTALEQGSDIADTTVENALYRRAVGFPYEERVDTEMTDGRVKVKRYTRYMPADVTACIYWLKNRKPDQWRDRKDVEDRVIEVVMNTASTDFSE